jgi:hypothetical protein
MTYQQWERGVSRYIREDSLWRVEAYRLALFLSDLAWTDVSRLVEDRRTVAIADQLYRAVGKISSNIGEGYSREQARIGRDFTSTHSVPLAKPAIGTTRAATCCPIKWPTIAWTLPRRSFG